MNAARICSLLCLAWILAFFPRDAPANEPNQVRLAVGPFSDSDGNQSFKDAVTLLPDLLTARLSADGRFQLLERQRISELWNELNLTVNGLDSSTTMLKLGKVLACDWFVTGSFVTTGTNTQIWVTVINTRDGVVRDVRLFPFQRGKVDDLAGQITAFLDQVQTNELPMKFIALGRFLDMSTSSKHEDWSWRLRTLIETRFRATGYSVVDNETVSPLFDEFQLQQAGFSESETNRVRFKTPFWLVDGLCKWVRDTNDELSVAIRIRQLGAGEYVIHLRAAPGAEMESNILNAIAVQLAGTNQVSAGAATLAEADLYSKEFQAVTRGKMVMPPARSSNTGAAPAVQPDRQDMRSEGLKESERAYLLDTNNLNAKFEVAMIYFSETNDPALQDRGDQMLEELMRCTNIFVAHRAYYPLAYGYAEFDRKQLQMVMLVKPRIKPDLQYEMNYQRQVFQITTNSLELSLAQHPHDDKAKLALGYALFNNNDDTLARRQGRRLLEELSTNDNQIISERAATVLQSLDAPDNRPTNSIQTPNLAPIPQSPPLDPTVRWPAYTLVDSFDGGQFRVVWDNGWLVNKGEKLSFYDRQDGKTDVPCPVNRAITALAADYKFWWVGNDDGIIQLTKSGEVVKTWTENDGLMALRITALCRSGHLLWVGFDGGLGFIDLLNGKFTGLQDDVNFTASDPDRTNRFDLPVEAILKADDKSIWISSVGLLQRRDALTGQLIEAFPKTVFEIVDAGTNFFAGTGHYNRRSIVSCLDLTNQSWNQIELSKKIEDNYLLSLAIDGGDVWAGGISVGTNNYSLLMVADMTSSKVIHRYAFNLTSIHWVGINGNDVWLLGSLSDMQRMMLYHFKKSVAAMASFSRPPLEATPPSQPLPPMGLSQARKNFLRAVFPKYFAPVPFQKDADGLASLQILHLQQNVLTGGNVLKWGADGDYYCGIKFTIPLWCDGDLKFCYALAKTAAQKDFQSHASHIGIFEENEDLTGAEHLNGFDAYQQDNLNHYSELHAKLPYSRSLNLFQVGSSHLQPGKTYVIWFSAQEEDHPDIAFAITINSERGVREFGPLPLR